jgi:hypothetical protein
MDRREFAMQLVSGAAVPVALAAGRFGADQADRPATPSQADQLLAMLQARLPDRLTDEQWKQVRGKIEGQLAAAKTLGEFKLQNSDEPATVFEVVKH